MKKILIATFVLCSGLGFGQGIDQSRMDRDLEVAKNVLQTLLGQSSNQLMWGRNIEATYLEGYGVIFTLPENFSYVSIRAPRADKSVGRAQRNWERATVINNGHTETFSIEEDSMSIEYDKQKKEAVVTFLADYSDLIGQLKPDDNIKVHSKSENDIFFVGVTGDDNWNISGNQGFSAEIKKKDVIAYREGKLTREELEKRIVFTESTNKEKSTDLELFASIVKRLYSPDLSDTYFTDRAPTYEVLSDFGVIFYLNTYSSYAQGDFFRMPVLARSDVDLEERNETVVDLYPAFEKSIKETMVEYGRTIKSLGEENVLMVKVKLTKCDECDLPESIEVSVTKKVLTQYDQRKISLDEAMKAVKIKKNMHTQP